MRLEDAFATFLPQIEEEMRSLVAPPDSLAAGHYHIMEYHLGWRDPLLGAAYFSAGKRIRPMLCVLGCGASGGRPEAAIPAAAGLELLHNFSLLHDDIEDDSPTRRHRPTAWVIFGMPLACNAADGMFGLSHLAFYRLREQGVPDKAVVEALEKFDRMCLRLTEGQYLDMSFETRLDVTTTEYDRMIAGKTGALLGCSPEIGALVAGASAAEVASYRRYGEGLGRAFQLQDDVLGIWGDEAETGKSVASDILAKKKSFPVVHALTHPATAGEMRERYAGPAFGPDDIGPILSILDRAESREATENEVRRASDAARAALDDVAPSANPQYLNVMRDLLEALVSRRT
jgi:geranylgeranyl diphosphate synthase type I